MPPTSKPRLKQLDAEARVRHTVAVRPDGMVQRVPTAGHAHAHIFARHPNAKIQGLSDQAKADGWALLDDLYTEELRDCKDPGRIADLTNGHKYVFEVYYAAVERGEPMELSMNPSPGCEVQVIGDHLLPKGVIERRARAKTRVVHQPPPPATMQSRASA
jgi:hypothetical protein